MVNVVCSCCKILMYSILSSVLGVTVLWVVVGIVLPFCVPPSPSRGYSKRRVLRDSVGFPPWSRGVTSWYGQYCWRYWLILFVYKAQGGYILYARGSLAGVGYYRQCRRRPAILPLQLWQGCQVCVKISTQRLPRVAQFNACWVHIGLLALSGQE